MTEAEWNNSTQPFKMLEAVQASRRASVRKVLLFGVATCRTVLHLTNERLARRALEIAERRAEGRATEREMRRIEAEMDEAYPEVMRAAGNLAAEAFEAAANLTGPDVWLAAAKAADSAADAATMGAARELPQPTGLDDEAWDAAVTRLRAEVRRGQSDLVRCIFGPLLFHPLPPVAPAVRTWEGGTVVKLAAGVYAERDFSQGRMGVVADAAEEAGLTDAAVLAHLRSPGPHARGCHGIDLLLGKV
jgi:hypothetical protein